MQNIKRFIFCAVCICFLLVKTSAQTDSSFIYKDSVRGQRYCEVVVVRGGLTNLVANVYNTLGVSACPEEQLKTVNVDSFKKVLFAQAVVTNGPRYYLMDKIGLYGNDTAIISFDSLQTRKWAALHLTIAMALKAKKNEPYKERGFKLATAKFFSKGSMVYEITSPEHTYIMESYSAEVNSSLTEAGLATLQQRLKLPDGWQYKAVTLDADLQLITDAAKQSYGMEDELGNRYQRIE